MNSTGAKFVSGMLILFQVFDLLLSLFTFVFFTSNYYFPSDYQSISNFPQYSTLSSSMQARIIRYGFDHFYLLSAHTLFLTPISIFIYLIFVKDELFTLINAVSIAFFWVFNGIKLAFTIFIYINWNDYWFSFALPHKLFPGDQISVEYYVIVGLNIYSFILSSTRDAILCWLLNEFVSKIKSKENRARFFT